MWSWSSQFYSKMTALCNVFSYKLVSEILARGTKSYFRNIVCEIQCASNSPFIRIKIDLEKPFDQVSLNVIVFLFDMKFLIQFVT